MANNHDNNSAVWTEWAQKIEAIQFPFPPDLPEPQRNLSVYFPSTVLDEIDLTFLKDVRNYKPIGRLEPLQIDQLLLKILRQAPTLDEQYRYLSALMHFPVSDELIEFWLEEISAENKHALLFAEDGGMPPILFQALLHGSKDHFYLFTDSWDADTWKTEDIKILSFCLRALGFSGDVKMAAYYFNKLVDWGVHNQVLNSSNPQLSKTFRDAKRYGHTDLEKWLLNTLADVQDIGLQWQQVRSLILLEIKRLHLVAWGQTKATLLNLVIEAGDELMSKYEEWDIHNLNDLFQRRTRDGYTLSRCIQYGMPAGMDSPLMLKIKAPTQALNDVEPKNWRAEIISAHPDLKQAHLNDLCFLLKNVQDAQLARKLVKSWRVESGANHLAPKEKQVYFCIRSQV